MVSVSKGRHCIFRPHYYIIAGLPPFSMLFQAKHVGPRNKWSEDNGSQLPDFCYRTRLHSKRTLYDVSQMLFGLMVNECFVYTIRLPVIALYNIQNLVAIRNISFIQYFPRPDLPYISRSF